MCSIDNKRFLLDDGIHTLAYGHKDLTAKVESIWEGPELFLMSFNEAKSKGLHPSHPVDPNMIQTRAPKRSIWQTRRKVAFDKAKKRIMEGMNGEQRHVTKKDGEEIGEEELPAHPAVTCETSTFLTPINNSYPFDNETKTEYFAEYNRCPLSPTSPSPISPSHTSQSTTSPSPTSPSPTSPSRTSTSPTSHSLSNNDPFDSDDSLCSDDSVF